MPVRRKPLPETYQPGKARQWSYAPDVGALLDQALAYARIHDVEPASSDSRRTLLFLVDVQRDFCFPEGALFVGGASGEAAMVDNERLLRFLFANIDRITEVACTLDTHYAHQIFFPAFWLDSQGRNPPANTEISLADIEAGRYRPDPEMVPLVGVPSLDWLERQVRDYCSRLEQRGQHRLFLWPPHCLLGSPGHNLVGAVDEARLFHAFARRARTPLLQKGRSLLTENYSALSTEVLEAFDGSPLGQRSQYWIDQLLSNDRVIIAGQASSHCVAATVLDLLREIERTDKSLAERFYLLSDCMSPVVLRQPSSPHEVIADFTFAADAMFERAREAGMKIVSSETPIEDWP